MSDYALVPISFGELLDKISILEIKRARIEDPSRKAHVARELGFLQTVRREAGLDEQAIEPVYAELKEINLRLWAIEDDIRACELRRDFGTDFVDLARSVYRTNDRRAMLKAQINTLTKSMIVEQKAYFSY